VIARGDIRWFRFGVPDKRRPVLVLGKPDVLPSLNQVPVIPLSTQARGLAWEVTLTEADGVPTACVVKPEWIRIVDRASLGPLVATLPEARWSDIRAALLDVLGFEP
jgi:mRNA-degrading endonuclease toxin of MazEF toxin-antitoxin module